MEVDRIKPHVRYTKNNIKLSCYWCNNAKTDEFSCEEFVSIAQEIRKVWEARLKNNMPNQICENDKLLTDWDDVNNVFFAFPYEMHSSKSKAKEWWKDLKSLINEIEIKKPAVKINLVFKDHEDVVKELKKEQYDKYRKKDGAYRLIPSPYLEDVWMRDFMPLAFNNNKALKAVYSPAYFNKEEKYSRKYSHIAGINIAEVMNIECCGLSKGSPYWHKEISSENEILPIVLDGGNFIHNGKIAFISARVLVENYDKDFKECDFNAILEKDNNEIKNLIKEKTNLK